MILITLGTQKFQFNRILREVDKLISDGFITNDVFAQTGWSDYRPKNYEYLKFLPHSEMKKLQEKADIIITHGGSGSIIEALNMHKKIIAVPRLAKFGEHVDDHQTEIVNEFAASGYIIGINDIKDLGNAIKSVYNVDFRQYKGSDGQLINAIREIIEA